MYLYIHDGKAEIRDASHLRGKDTKETWAELQAELQLPGLRVAAIGPAGEKMSLLACPINDGHRAPGRGGGGAVMGSNNLKAVAVYGTGKISVADPDKIKEINRQIAANIKNNPGAQAFSTMGTGSSTAASALSGDSPVKNWSGVGITDIGAENAEKLSAASLDKYKVKKYSCFNCPLGCGAILAHGSAYAAEKYGKGKEYQTASGIELPMHDPRLAPGFARTYQYDPTPGKHVKGSLGLMQAFGAIPDKYNYSNTGPMDVRATAAQEVENCAGLCTFISMCGIMDIKEQFLTAVTGRTFTQACRPGYSTA